MYHYLWNEELFKDRDFVLKAIDINYRIMENRIKDFVNDREILKKYLSKNGEFLRILNYLPHVVQVDEELLTIVLKNSGISMMHAPRHLVTKKLAIMAIKEDALAYAYCNNFFDDFDVTIEAVSINGKMIKYSNQILKQNKEIVLAAVRQNKDAYEFIDESLKFDVDIYLQFERMYHLLRPKANQKIWNFKNLFFTFTKL